MNEHDTDADRIANHPRTPAEASAELQTAHAELCDARRRLATAEADYAKRAYSVRVEYAPSMGATSPGPLDAVLAEIAQLQRDAAVVREGRWAEVVAERDAAVARAAEAAQERDQVREKHDRLTAQMIRRVQTAERGLERLRKAHAVQVARAEKAERERGVALEQAERERRTREEAGAKLAAWIDQDTTEKEALIERAEKAEGARNALQGRLHEVTAQLENALDVSQEGSWMARALDAERECERWRSLAGKQVQELDTVYASAERAERERDEALARAEKAEQDRDESVRQAGYRKGWNEALIAAATALIVLPARFKTTNNVPDYFLERGEALEALEAKTLPEER